MLLIFNTQIKYQLHINLDNYFASHIIHQNLILKIIYFFNRLLIMVYDNQHYSKSYNLNKIISHNI